MPRNPGVQPIPLIWPVKGLVDDTPFGQQPPGTTREALNVRNIDPKTGRTRGGQRPGLSRWMPSPVNGANKIQDLATVIADDRLVTYAAVDPATDTEEFAFEKTTESLNLPATSVVSVDPIFEGSLGVSVDDGGNSYFLDGRSGITKYNHDGVKLFTIPLPVADDKDLVRALAVDDLGFIFAGVSGGAHALVGNATFGQGVGTQETARLWAYLQEPDNGFVKLWELETGDFIERIRVKDDLLYTAQNDLSGRRSFVRVYRNIDSRPVLDWEQEVSFPLNDIAVSSKSIVYFTSQDFDRDQAGLYPLSPNAGMATEDWRLERDLKDEEVVWAHYRASDITLGDVVGDDLADNPGVLFWKDRSGNGRHWYANTIDGTSAPGGEESPPTFRLRGFAEKPCVAFDGVNQSMVSLANPGVAASIKDAQRTPIPGYTGSMYAMVMVCRLEIEAVDRCILFAENDTAGATDHVLCQNRTSNGSLGSGVSAGKISYFADTAAADPGAGAGGHLDEGDINTTGLSIITVIWDGGIDPGAGTTKTKCLIRIDGEPLDRCGGEGLTITNPVRLGHDPNNTLTGNLKGEIYEMVFLARKTDTATGANAILSHPKYPDVAFSPGGHSALERIEGQLAHRYGNFRVLAAQSSSFPHPYGLDPADTGTNIDAWESGPPNRLGTPDPSIVGRLMYPLGLVGKIAAGNAGIRWIAFTEDVTTPADGGGIGYAVEATLDGNVYTAGADENGDQIVRKVIDQGDDYDLDGSGAWFDNPTTDSIDESSYMYIRLATDKFDNLYLPGHYGGSTSGPLTSPEVLTVYDSAGTILQDFKFTTLSNANVGFLNAVAVDPRIPEYGTGGIDIAEWVVMAGDDIIAAGDDTPNIFKMRLIEVASQTGSARTMKVLAVSGGNVYTVDTTAATIVTGGTAALAATAKYIQSAVFKSKVYFADGEKTMVYDPVTNTIAKWTSTSPGGIPVGGRCKLNTVWQNRMVLAGDPDDPTRWYMSAIGDSGDFDFFPPVPESGSAVEGETSRAGLTPDIVTCLFPINDDLLVFGLDSSTYILRGNPNDGGVFDLLGHETGLAFGQPGALDDDGRLWVMGREGGVYLVTAQGLKSVTDGRIDRRLRDIDYENHYVRAYWNPEEQGVHWFLHPFGGEESELVRHWFHDLRNDAWWEDEFGKTDVQPTAGLLIDGDLPDDRVFLIGCADGRIRLWDEDAVKDDDVAMDSHVLFGPFVPGGAEYEYGFNRATFVLARDQSGCRLQGFAQNEPDKLGMHKFSVTLQPGRNAPRLERMAGSHCWYRLRNSAQERWAYESGSVIAYPLAHARPR